MVTKLSRRAVAGLCAIVLVAAAGIWAAMDLEEHLTVGGFKDENSPSFHADRELEDRLGIGAPNVIVRIAPVSGSVDSPETRATAEDVVKVVAQLAVPASIQSYWESGLPYLKSQDGRSALILATLPGDEDAADAAVRALGPDLDELEIEGINVGLTGQAEILREATDVSKDGLVRAELIAVPISVFLLLLIFGSLTAAALPVVLGVLCSLSSLLVMRLLTMWMDVSVFALNLVTGLALGLAIDYSLLIIARYRETLSAIDDPTDEDYRRASEYAVRRTRRTVIISTATIAIALGGVLMIDLGYLRSIALAGIVVVAVTAFLVLVVMPIALALLGRRIDSLMVRKVDLATPGAVMRRLLAFSTRRPLVVSVVAGAILVGLFLPFLGVKFGPVDDRVLPADSEPYVVAEQIRVEFPQLGSDIMIAVLPGETTIGEGETIASTLSQSQGVSVATSAWGTFVGGSRVAPGSNELAGDAALSAIALIPHADLDQQELLELARSVRADIDVHDGTLAGTYADELDKQQAIASRIPFVLAIVVSGLLPMVFLATGSIVIALKTMLLTGASLTASFGALVWVFQDGNLSNILGFTPTGSIDVTAPVLLLCLAFGLSMDYQIMLLSRIREEYDRSGDTAHSVAFGIERTAKVLSAAALLIGVVFLAIGTGGTTIVKILGIGLAIAVLMDAFVVRIALVPSLMLMLGRWNWWSPKWALDIYRKLGLERPHLDDVVPSTDRAPVRSHVRDAL